MVLKMIVLSGKAYQSCSPAHIAAGFTTSPEGKCMPINVEVIGRSLMVQHYIAHPGEPTHLILESVSDVFTPAGRNSIHVHWELSVKKVDDNTSEFTNRVQSRATEDFTKFIDEQGIPFEQFKAQRQPASIYHNQTQTPLFAKSIERHTLGKK